MTWWRDGTQIDSSWEEVSPGKSRNTLELRPLAQGLSQHLECRGSNNNLTQPDQIVYLVFYGLLIIGFAYFYTAISFDPVKQADTIRKQGGYIPGIRPGPQTERYLGRILNRITLPGALFIAAVAIVPSLFVSEVLGVTGSNSGSGGGSFRFVGTSLLIAVGVALETMKQIDSQLMMRNYEGFLK